ncbi:domain containing protein [Moniliophthora roreri MCA 2997]|uniref:Domain containing protein n=1 Tax=Moniliophthora roreri (strain MCA 2997) TaxID=1381753 RepID=V2XZ19_MONRO|nr:domain containing protein [Moniliophthora roreri MCA 2997]
MATNLYETLGIPKDATPEQIRKAYKKRALDTHPDRHPNATPSEKARLEESFREVSNAYEVLNDPQNRRLYDVHGVWPPPNPDEEPSRRPHRGHSSRHRRHDPFDDPSFKDPFFNDPFFQRSHRHFSFTDPFDLFERIFPRHVFDDPIYPNRHHHHNPHRSRDFFQSDDPFALSRHTHNDLNNFMSSMHRNMLMGFGDFPALPADQSSASNGQARYARQVHITKTVNGVTHTVQKTRDWDGNERVIKTFPDGRQVVTVNGLEQRDQGYLPSSSRNPPPDPRHAPPPPPPLPSVSQGYGNSRLPPPPPYTPDREYPRHHRSRTHSSHRDTRESHVFYDSFTFID